MATYRLTEEERRQLETDGYVLRERVFDAGELVAISDACETLLADIVRGYEGKRHKVGSYVFDPDDERDVTIKWEGDSDVVHGLEPFAHLSPVLEEWAYDRRLIDPMIDMVRDDQPVLFTEKLNLKRPRVGGFNPLHQDFPYWENFAEDATRVATAMLFLDDTSLENGTLQVVPGSHRSGKWRTRTDSDRFGNLEIDPDLDGGGAAVPIEVTAGAVVYFGPFLAHKSSPNTSTKERRTLLYSYQPHGLTHSRDLYRRWRESQARAATEEASV